MKYMEHEEFVSALRELSLKIEESIRIATEASNKLEKLVLMLESNDKKHGKR